MPDPDWGLDWARMFAQAAREIAATEGQVETLHAIAQYANQVCRCQWAAIARAARAATPVVAATSDTTSAEMIASIQASGGGGPTWAAVGDCESVYVPDVLTETRWPAHIAELRANTPVRSILALCLELDGEVLGALTLYSDKPEAFPEEMQELLSVYADHAAIAIERENTGSRVDHLESAVQSNREIGVAMGILVERHKITTDQAFDLLRVASQHSHRKLYDVATDLVHSGELIGGPSPEDSLGRRATPPQAEPAAKPEPTAKPEQPSAEPEGRSAERAAEPRAEFSGADD